MGRQQKGAQDRGVLGRKYPGRVPGSLLQTVWAAFVLGVHVCVQVSNMVLTRTRVCCPASCQNQAAGRESSSVRSPGPQDPGLWRTQQAS